MLKFICCTLVLCALYTVELSVITNLFMPIAKFNWKRTIIYGGTLILVCADLIYIQGMSTNTWYIILPALILNNLFYEGKLKIRICAFFLTYAISAAGQTVVRILINRIYLRIGYEANNFITGDFLIYIGALFVAVCVSCYLKKEIMYERKEGDYDDLSWASCIGLSLMSIIYTSIFQFLCRSYLNKEKVVISSRVLFLCLYLTIFMVILFIKYQQLKLKKNYELTQKSLSEKMFKKQISSYNHLEEVHQMGEEVRTQIEKEMRALLSASKAIENKEIEAYIQDVKEHFPYSTKKVMTGNEIVDMILYEKEIRAKALDITLKSNVSIPNTLYINNVDLYIILDYTMDYVMKACLKGNNKQIEVKGIWFKKCLVFEITYALAEEVREEAIAYEKTPNELLLVEACLKKYQGSIEVIQEEAVEKIELNLSIGGESDVECTASSN